LIFRAIRPLNLIAVVLLQVLCFYAGGLGTISSLILYIVLPTVLTTAGGYLINDHFDQKRDRINNKEANKVDLGKYFLYYYLGLNLIALVLAALDGWELTILVLGIQLVLWLYSKWLSSLALVGNVLVALLSCFTIVIFYFSTSVSIHINNIWVAWVAIFLVSMARELIKDNQDYEGDKADGAQTLPILTSKGFTHILADLFLFCNIFFIASWTFFDFYLNNQVATVYGSVVVVLGILIIVLGHLIRQPEKDALISKALKFYMFVGMLIILFLNHV